MTDSMKFGPEWLRNMSQDGIAAPTSSPRYQLAEHRYGREEMLALFDTLVKAPDPLASFPGLYVDKTQVPLALIQMTEEETRHWNRGINSDAVLRAMGKAPPPSVNTTLRGTGRGGPVGPGGLSDRGRGRGRGGFTSYPRTLSHEEAGDAPSGPPHLGAPPGGYTRGTRPFDRSQSDRNWGERNGLDASDWGSTSPRKDFSSERDRDRVITGSGGTRGYSGTDNNWRRHRTSEDDEGWRTMGSSGKDKWGGAGTGGAPRNASWRDGDRERERDDEIVDGRPNYNRPHRPWEHYNLPEWAVDGADSSGGSFDAQGAFHGGHTYSDEEEDRVGGTPGRRTRLLSEGHSGNGRRSGQGDGSPSTNHSALRRNVLTDRASAERASERLTPYVDKQNDVRVPSPSSPPREETNKNEETSSQGVRNSRSDPDLKSNKEPSPSERIKTPDNEHLAQPSKAPAPPQQARSPQHHPQSQLPQSSPQHQQPSHPHPLATSASMPALSMPNNHQENHVDTRQLDIKQGRHKSEDAMDRMKEVADDLVAKLMEDEEGPLREDEVPRHRLPHVASHNQHREPDKWFYRDPQGQVQGPFSSEEMMEWFRSGYFNLNLLVRRAKDERFSQLQDLIKVFGGIPFISDAIVPPIKGTDPVLSATPILPTPSVGISGSIIPQLGQPIPKLPLPGMPNVPGVPGVDQDMLMAQHQFLLQQQQQQQQLLLRQQTQAAAVVSKLSQSEGWASLSQMDQQQLVVQHIQQLNALNPQVEPVAPFMNAIPATSPSNPVLALISQIQQKQQPPQTPQQQHHQPQRLQQGKESSGQQGQSLDPIQHLIQQMGGLSSRVSPPTQLPPPSLQQQQQQPPPQPAPTQQQQPSPFNPIQSLMQQLGISQQQPPQQQQAQQPQQPPHQVDSLWGSPLPVYAPGGWLPGIRPQMGMSGVPPGGPLLPPTAASLWGDLTTTKEMKTEKQILEEQLNAEEERKEQLRRKEEEKQRRQAEEEAALAPAAVEAEKQQKKAEEAKRKEEEARHKDEQHRAEEERKRQEEVKRQEAARKKEEDKRKKEEEKRRKDEEKERKKQEEEERKRQEEDRQRKAREEEEARKAEAQRQQAEAVRKTQEQQRQAQAAAKSKAEQEEQARRAEAQRQQAEALRKMQEQQQRQAQVAAAVKTAKVAPWSQPQAAKPVVQVASLSLAEIQRNQKRENYEQMREQQMILQQIQQQNQQNQQSALLALSLAAAEGNGQPAQMQLKWAERKPPPPPEAKTLEQIQREEQERVAKQLERDRAERAERAAAVRDVTPNPTVGIWGSANQSLTWGSSGNSGPGFWDEVTSPAVSPVKPAPAPAKKNTPVKSASTSNMPSASMPAQAQSSAKNSNSATKKKKEEATVMKLFEQTVQRSDEFSQWCHKALASLNPSVDIPTFVGFLRDVESPYEVKDYVRLYLGEGEAPSDFARQFLERRSKWRSERRSKPAQDDMCAPAPAINPAPQQTSHDFQEVKGKGKKSKKGKMYKVDSRILGFSVTAAPDRINVGDRDYGEGI